MADNTKTGYKQAGEMSERTRAQYDANIRSILQKWNIESYQDAFPESIRPTTANYTAIFNYHKQLEEIEIANAASQEIGQEKAIEKPRARDRSAEVTKNDLTNLKASTTLIPSGKMIPPTFSSTPSMKTSISDLRTKPRTKEVNAAKKPTVEGAGLEKSVRHRTFEPLNASQRGPKKRPGAMAFDDAKQGDRRSVKKPRKEENPAYIPVQAPNVLKPSNIILTPTPIDSLSKELFSDDNHAVEPSSTNESISDENDNKFTLLGALMQELNGDNAKVSSTATTSSANYVMDAKGVEFNAKFLAPPVSKRTFSTLNPGELEVTIPGLEGQTMVADADVSKPINVAPVADMGLEPHTTEKTQKRIQPPESGITDENTIVPQPSLLQQMASEAGGLADPLTEHCGWIANGLRDVLDTTKLHHLAREDQRALARDLHAAFETTIRHLEGDIAWVFRKHGAKI